MLCTGSWFYVKTHEDDPGGVEKSSMPDAAQHCINLVIFFKKISMEGSTSCVFF